MTTGQTPVDDTPGRGGPRTRRIVLTAVAAVAAAVVLAGVAWLIWVGNRPTGERPRPGYEPAQETTAPPMPSVLPTASPDATAGPGSAEDTSAASGGEAPPSPSPFTRAPRIAYRLGTTLYVANEDGTAPSPVARIAEGPYALAPDGLTLAVVTEGRLKLIDTTTGAQVDAAAATEVQPVWMPDSSAVVYAIKSGRGLMRDIRRIGRDGSGDVSLRLGSAASVSPNGEVVAILAVEETSGSVFVSRSGGPFKRVSAGAGVPTAVAAGDDRVYVGMSGKDDAWIASVGLDGRATRLTGAPAGEVPAVWGALCLSPNGTHLGAVAEGDDEYSRVSVLSLSEKSMTAISLRRDGYARCWSADGRSFFYVEGNAYQGESTVLYRVAPDGTGRRVVATGAE